MGFSFCCITFACMKRTAIVLLMVLSVCTIHAQREYNTGNFRQNVTDHGNCASPADLADGIDFSEKPVDSVGVHLPTLTDRGTMAPINMFPYYGWNYGLWDLHPGLNVSLGASVSVAFGKGAYSGAGFEQNISMMYAVPLSKRLSLAIGGYFENINWGRYTSRDAGLNAVLGYQFNDHWSAYAYLQKSLVSHNLPAYMNGWGGYGYGFGRGDIGDRIGAAVRYSPNKNFSFEVSVEADRRPATRGYFY